MAKKKAEDREQVCRKNDILELKISDMGNEGEGIGKIAGYPLFVKDAIAGDVARVKVMKTRKNFGYARLIEIIEPSKDRVTPACDVARPCGGCQLQHCSYARQLEWKQEKIAGCLNRIGGQHVALPGESRLRDAGQQEKGEETGLSAEEQEKQETASVQMEPILGMESPYYYRNKAQFPVGLDREGNPVAGFYAGRTHQIAGKTDCIIQHPCNRILVDEILAFIKEYNISVYDEVEHRGLIRHILTRVGVHTGEVMVCLVINGQTLPHSDKFVERLLYCQRKFPTGNIRMGEQDKDLFQKRDKQFAVGLSLTSICVNINTQKTNAILGSEIKVLYGRPYIEDKIGEIKYHISPLSFYQVNPEQTKKLYDTALEYADLQGGEVVWDLYCGIGTISLFLAQKAGRVCGVEIVPQAVEDARKNAELNGMQNVEFFLGAAEDVVPDQYEKSGGRLKADVVVVDPPRKGCDERLLETVVHMAPERIVYVSCDPATLARDVKYLCEKGYELKRVRGCDMFGMGFHVETVVLLSR